MWKQLLFIALIIASSLLVQAQEDTTCPADFTGFPPPRLVVGEQARVMADVALNVRPQPTTHVARIGYLPAGTSFAVLAGPACSDGYVWWQGEVDALTGWMAEGRFSAEGEVEYWLEPRGELVIVEREDGVERRYVRDAEGNLEPEGCLRPPDDYTRVQQGYATLNARTLAMLDHAQRLYNQMRGGPVNFRQAITQGSYNPGGVEASFGTHDGGGAVDISVRSPLDWSVLEDEIEPMVEVLRIAGFAAWLRDTGELYPNSPIHIHAIAIGDAELSPVARGQIDGDFGYLRGYNGLPREDGIPLEDRHGDPVICRWMVEMGFDDLRDSASGQN